MKKLLIALALLLPGFAQAAITVPWTATSTDLGFISPSKVNGNNPWLVVSGTGTSTFANGISITGGCYAINGTCITSGSGTVTSIATTWPLLGGTITTTGTLTFGGLSTSTNAVVGNIPYFSGANTFANVATSTLGFSAAFSGASALGTLVGGSNSTIDLAANGVALTKLATIAANSVLGNNTGSTGNVIAFATSTLGIAISDTTGTLGVSRGGTGQATFTASQLLYGNGTNALSSIGTSTLSASSPLTGSFTQIGSGGSLGCQSASGSQAGCLLSADWTTFNSKQAPGFQIATTSSIGISKVAYFTGTAGTVLGGVATSSIAAGAGLTGTLTTLGSADSIALTIPVVIASGGTNATSQTSNGINYFDGTKITSGTKLTYDGVSTTTLNSSVVVATTSATTFQVNDNFGTKVLNVGTASTTGSIFTVAATTSPSLSSPIKLFDVDQYGHLTASSTGSTATVSCSPSGGSVGTNANDIVGDFTTGTLSTSCTITFARAYSATPEVLITGGSTASVVGVTARSTTAFTVGLGTAATGDDISYLVLMP